MKVLKMAWLSWLGYRVKALSLFVFTTFAFVLILLGVDALYNSFNLWFDAAGATYLPRFFVSGQRDFDFDKDYGISELAVPAGTAAKLEAELGASFSFHEAAIAFSILNPADDPERQFWALVIGVDIEKLGEVFPALEGVLNAEEVKEFKRRPMVLLNAKWHRDAKEPLGKEYILLSQDYYRDYNAIRLKVAKVMEPLSKIEESTAPPIAYIDIGHLRRLFALPADEAFPLIPIPKKPVPHMSFANNSLTSLLARTVAPLGLDCQNSFTVSKQALSNFNTYLSIIWALIAVLVIVLVISISSNLFVSYQSRLADFGLYKAFGLGAGRLFLFILFENAIGILFPWLLALGINGLVGALVPPFIMIGNYISLGLSGVGILTLSGAAAFICLTSVLQSWRFLSRLECVPSMGEE